MTEPNIIDGKAFAARLRARIAECVAALQQSHGLTPGLSLIHI